ncbi:PQQ-dependent sugar dehydrogenase [Tundrisphaera sp. TA3]|uniref:PQQ-dependent sugar dehydrogenase n=1 Tax=Tundrisphaera sp. TA3 TaxID=3435775 RepID=UPI003EB85CBC
MTTLPIGFSEAAVATGIVDSSGLADAATMEVAPEGRVWVLGQGGKVSVFHAGSTQGFTALTIPPATIDYIGERGLIGIAFDPSYDVASPAPDYVYLYYTSVSGTDVHNRISRFTVDNADPDRPTLSDETVIVDLDRLTTATAHNGGAIHFGPDGKLYVAVGDNVDGTNSQNLGNRLGKILRYNPDGSIPEDNPASFPGISGTTTGVNRAIWAVGLRNPYTFTFQPGTGVMYINDVGQVDFEEVNLGVAGANYGWPLTEGDFDPAAYPDFTRPIYSYAHGSGALEGYAITGGAFYNPPSTATERFPSLFDGDYFITDFVNGWINVIDAETKAVSQFATGISYALDLRVAPDGSLLYLSRGEKGVFRIYPSADRLPSVTRPPEDLLSTVDEPATFTVTASGATPFLYQWERAEAGSDVFVPIERATEATYVLTSPQIADNGARFRVVLSNMFGSDTSAPATLSTTTNRRPSATISIDGGLVDGKFIAGQPVVFTATGTDPEDGPLGNASLTYRVEYITSIASGNPPLRPFLPEAGVEDLMTFSPATTGPYTLADVAYRITVTATDSEGRTSTASRDLFPNVATITVTTDPSGLTTTLDGEPSAAPITFEGVVGFERPIGVDEVQTLDGRRFEFVSWNDGGAATHTIITPMVATTYVASFKEIVDTIDPPPIDPPPIDPPPIDPPPIDPPPINPPPINPPPIIPVRPPVAGDFDGDRRTDLAVYLTNAGAFGYLASGSGMGVLTQFGLAGGGQTIPAVGDYDGDGRSDVAAYLPGRALYAYRPSSGGGDVVISFGAAGVGGSIPVPGDYFGTGRDEVAVYLPAFGAFAIRPVTGTGDVIIPFGLAGAGRTLPAVGDYDGDGKDDIAAYLPSLGLMAIRPSGGGGDLLVQFGAAGLNAVPIPGDYDGDGRTDLALYFPDSALFAYRPSGGGPDAITRFGSGGENTIPVPGDYSGSGRTEIAFFHAPSANFAFRPAGGGPDVIVPFGSAGVATTLPALESPGHRAAASGSVTTPPRTAQVPDANPRPGRGSRAASVTRRAALPRRPVVSALQTAKRPGNDAAQGQS